MEVKEMVAMKLKFRPKDIQQLTIEEVRLQYASSIDPVVLEVATQDETTTFWRPRAGGKCFMVGTDDGEPVALDDLRYDSRLGLHSI